MFDSYPFPTHTKLFIISLLVLGGWRNQQSAVVCYNDYNGWTVVNTPNLLHAEESREFYVSFPGGTLLEVGRVGELPFISHQMDCTVDVKHIGIISGLNAELKWTFCGYGK